MNIKTGNRCDNCGKQETSALDHLRGWGGDLCPKCLKAEFLCGICDEIGYTNCVWVTDDSLKARQSDIVSGYHAHQSCLNTTYPA